MGRQERLLRARGHFWPKSSSVIPLQRSKYQMQQAYGRHVNHYFSSGPQIYPCRIEREGPLCQGHEPFLIKGKMQTFG